MKRRKVSRQTKKGKPDAQGSEPLFAPLLNGAETPECVRLRQQLFEESWAQIDGRIQVSCPVHLRRLAPRTRLTAIEGILRDSNSSTLCQVTAFVAAAEVEW